MVQVELGDGFGPYCDIHSLGWRSVRLDQHHPQVLVHLHVPCQPVAQGTDTDVSAKVKGTCWNSFEAGHAGGMTVWASAVAEGTCWMLLGDRQKQWLRFAHAAPLGTRELVTVCTVCDLHKSASFLCDCETKPQP